LPPTESRYEIVGARSQVSIDARSSLHPIHSETKGLEGWLELATLADGRLDLGVTPKGRLSLPVRLLRSGNGLEDRELQRRIDARRFPTIDGELSDLDETEHPGCYRMRGEISFRGVTRTCESHVTITLLDERTVRLEGRSRFDIRDFGMEPPRILVLRVHPEVEVSVAIIAVREG